MSASSNTTVKPQESRRILRMVWILSALLIVSCFYYDGKPNQQLDPVTTGKHADSSSDLGRKLLQTEEDSFPDCIPPSIQDFPDDFFTQSERLRGGVVIHFLIAAYFCGMLAIICDDYFVPSLEILCDAMQIPSDVAGASFMAIGSSAPEFFSSVIGAFITEGDIGIGTILGTAVFNLLGVTMIVSFIVWKTDVPLDWYPLSRDSFVYTITVAALAAVLTDNVIRWWEAVILMLMFFSYILLMYFNTRIEGFCTLQVEKLKIRWLSNHPSLPEQEATNEKSPLITSASVEDGFKESTNEDTRRKHLTVSWGTKEQHFLSVEESIVEKRSRRESNIIMENVKEMNEETREETSVWHMPVTGSLRQIWWVLMWPASFLFYITVLDCRKQNLRKYYMITFLMSVVWIGIISYLIVWMITIIGYTLGIPDTVSGLTLLAAGTSVPEIISSIIVVRNGLGNMAMCNLIGSNIFNVLFCLGAPWLIRTLIPPNKGFLIINSSGLMYTTVTLLATIVALFIFLYIFKWNLNYRIGFSCMVIYGGFLVLACMYELNFFGEFNPPQCLLEN
ncbi:sodium/potassium/calcium exchanger 3-like [Limulus polyphemus]|uniref:Sodium/potassium/calcium exchanger 3-like n=1 Tax=Limulus polyphemus TaxID=6850 RepID=A0ABM1SA23_LIMPO|nr:sodium/potassium/calcium exchanger 3-like [Limulus polyphemus]